MKYNETTAKELKEKYNLADTTLRTWQHRNSIPDKYFLADYSQRQTISRKAENVKEDWIKNTLQREDINAKSLLDNLGLDYWLYVDRKRDRIRLSKQEVNLISKRVKKIAGLVSIARSCDDSGLKRILLLPEIVVKTALKIDMRDYGRLSNYLNGRTKSMQPDFIEKIRGRLISYLESLN